MNTPLIEKYKALLPVTDKTPIISLGEGGTPLVKSVSIGPSLGCDLYFKLEGCNPTGSFKDRGMVVAIAKALEAKKSRIVCASTGNTSASAAAYGARFGLKTDVLVPEGKISQGKLAQAKIYGARIVQISGNFDQALNMVRKAGSVVNDLEIVNSINENRIAGQTTAAYEVSEALESMPQIQCMPVGNAGNITAYWRGYRNLKKINAAKSLPVMYGFQASGAAPIVKGHTVESPETFATAIRIGNPASWEGALSATTESSGRITDCSENEIASAYTKLANLEGIFSEPASAISIAGLLKISELGVDLKGKLVVAILTGSGLKDVDSALKKSKDNFLVVDSNDPNWIEKIWTN